MLCKTWFEWMNGKFKEVAKVTISSNTAAATLLENEKMIHIQKSLDNLQTKF